MVSYPKNSRYTLITGVILCLFSTFISALEINTEKYFLSNLSPYQSIEKRPAISHTVNVSNTKELIDALSVANQKNNTTIYINKGKYHLRKTLFITGNNIRLIATDKNPFNTIITGNGMRATKDVDNLLRVSGKHFFLEGVTLQQAGNHLIQIAGESDAHYPIIRNSVLQDGYEQLIKVTYNLKQPENFAIQGLIENCLFRYTAGIGPNYYIGGIDAHGIKHWVIKNNVFENIASPSQHIAEHAIHIWNNAAHNNVLNNLIMNSDRGIGFGMRNGKQQNLIYGHLGGEIRNNLIYHADNNNPYADTGIIIEESPETNITNNIIILEHNYPNAIEYRFKQTQHVFIAKNISNKRIKKRNNADAILIDNIIDKQKAKAAFIEKLAGFVIENKHE